MESIIERIKQHRLWSFPGGVHPPSRKDLSNQSPIGQIDWPEKLYITVKQHIGTEGRVLVEKGQHVLKGQALTRSGNPFAVPVHAPTSATIVDICQHPSAHPSAVPEQTIVLQPDGEDKWTELKPLLDYQQQHKSKVVEAICQAGISGMGGAGFPTHIKVAPKKDVQFLIINGVECEPYITSDDRLMREHAWQIRQGIDVLHHLLTPLHVVIAVEDNKPEAAEAMRLACRDLPHYQVCTVPTKYPAGGEKQLIQTLTGKEVPKQGLPIDLGIIMQNVGTCFAIADAIFTGKPLIQRVVTLTGEAVKHPGNRWVPIGTPVRHLLQQGGYQAEKQHQPRAIMGGPMMGFSLPDGMIPVVKTTNCILVPSDEEMPDNDPEQACIRCGACADACPVNLLPQQLYWYSQSEQLDKAQQYNLFDCIECGACAYVCPSNIPLVHYYRTAKADIRTEQLEKHQAERAKERFEARNARLAREQQEREEKHRKAAEARRQAMNKQGSDAKDKIAAALARAKAKKQAAGQQTDSASSPATETQQSDKKQQVAAAIARAKAKRQVATQGDPQHDPTDSQQPGANHDDNGNAVASTQSDKLSEQEDKKQRVAAAIARAKAKRQAATQAEPQHNPTVSEQHGADHDNNEDSARVTQPDTASEQDKSEQNAPTATDNDDASQLDKQQRIAAAVAKAKAKRQAAQKSEEDKS